MKKNLYPPILINTALIICLTFSLYGLAIDLPLIEGEFRPFYVGGRLLVAFICSLFLFQVNILKIQYPAQVPMIYSLIIAYCIQGQVFVNGYYLAFMQAIAGFSLFFPMPKKYYYPITFVGNLLILVAIWTGLYHYSEDAAKIFKFNMDTSLGIVLISVICLVGYITITLAREQKQILAEKFLDVGRYFGNFVHDLKGIVSSPTVYVELLAAELNKEAPSIDFIREVVTNLKADVYSINDKVLGINNLSKNSDEIVPIDIRKLVGSLEKHFFARDNLNVSIVGTKDYVIGNEYSVRSIILNLINNSKENFQLKGIESPSISIEVGPQKITFRDNGGGFSKNALKKINQNSFFTDKAHGSGMGLFTVKEYMSEFNGSAYFSNRTDGTDGAQIELTFAKRV